jgi:hypothetical protein
VSTGSGKHLRTWGHSGGAKAPYHFEAVTARLKLRPFKTKSARRIAAEVEVGLKQHLLKIGSVNRTSLQCVMAWLL